ncbi:MAG TPA: aminotransferase class V-fold PLP-dependent enzyme [Gemmatimonadaceae bacterium]|nr:aminotransferase class V-fold PLP-dependent enzyme [Gemmatimonadaceae bacterium]
MQRRTFLAAAGLGAVGAAAARPRATAESAEVALAIGPTVEEWRRHFPALAQRVNGRELAYLDTAATALRPTQVIDAVAEFYAHDNANPGATLHTLARRANERYEAVRARVARFLNASDPSEVVFTRGTTDGINLVAAAWGGANLRSGDEVLIGVAEHASNMLPWQLVAKRTGAVVRYFDIDDEGRVRLDDVAARLTPRTKVVAFSHVSNVLGMVNPVTQLCAMARAPGRIVLVDGAQSVPHLPVDVRELGCDFLAFSSHKMLGPMGVGVLWGRRELLDAMPPYQGGSNMAHDVDLDSLHLSEGALKFGAGTPNVSGPVGLAAAIDFLTTVGHDALRAHELQLTRRMLERLRAIPGLRLLGTPRADERISVFAFTMAGRTPAEVVTALDGDGIAIRGGDLAALPLLKRLGTTRAARASCYLYTTVAEVDRFADAVERLALPR